MLGSLPAHFVRNHQDSAEPQSASCCWLMERFKVDEELIQGEDTVYHQWTIQADSINWATGIFTYLSFLMSVFCSLLLSSFLSVCPSFFLSLFPSFPHAFHFLLFIFPSFYSSFLFHSFFFLPLVSIFLFPVPFFLPFVSFPSSVFFIFFILFSQCFFNKK